MTDLEIIDNFLPVNQFNKVQQDLMSNKLPWFVNDDIVHTDLGNIASNTKHNWQLFHLFYYNPLMHSEYISAIEPILQHLNPLVLIKAKANTNYVTESIVEHGMHIDIQNPELKSILTTGIFYVNNNDGYTLLEDGTKIESVANRFVSFPTETNHSGTSCTNTNRRVVLNLNYIKQTHKT